MVAIFLTAFTIASAVIRTTVFVVHAVGQLADPLPPNQGPQIPNDPYSYSSYSLLVNDPVCYYQNGPEFVATQVGLSSWRTANFVVNSPSSEFSRQVAVLAEEYRMSHALEWLGKPLPGNWNRPCVVECVLTEGGCSGHTSFNIKAGEVVGWEMKVQGTKEGILTASLPHEVMHTITASHFRKHLPRWLDEGACMVMENESEQLRQKHLLAQMIDTSQRIPLRTLFGVMEYGNNMQKVMALYAHSYSITRYLVNRGGKPEFIKFCETGLRTSWDDAVTTHYGIPNVDQLEADWIAWVKDGSPEDETTVASVSSLPVMEYYGSSVCPPCTTHSYHFRKGSEPHRELTSLFQVKYYDFEQYHAQAAARGITTIPAFFFPDSGDILLGYPYKTPEEFLMVVRKYSRTTTPPEPPPYASETTTPSSPETPSAEEPEKRSLKDRAIDGTIGALVVFLIGLYGKWREYVAHQSLFKRMAMNKAEGKARRKVHDFVEEHPIAQRAAKLARRYTQED